MTKQFLIVISLFVLAITGVFILALSLRTYRVSLPSISEKVVSIAFKSPDDIQLNQPTIESIFEPDHHWVATLSATKVTRLLVTGDVLTARTVNSKNKQLNNFTWPFLKTADVLKAADITFINLETPLVPDCPVKTEGMVFCGDLRSVEGLTFAGVDMVNLANNHMGNYGLAGVESTQTVLHRAGIKTTGLGGPTIIQQAGTSFAFLGYNEVDHQIGVPYPTDELIRADIKAAEDQADVTVVQFHWGNEYTHRPSTNQQRLAHLAIDAGADLVVGNHPHWWQPIEIYKGKLITYSHGNFVFDQMWSQETREGIVGLYTFYEDALVDVELMPVLIENYGQPRWLEGSTQTELLKAVKQLSGQLQLK